MNEGQKVLSETVHYLKYAKHIESEERRETWTENINRFSNCMVDKYCRDEEGVINKKNFAVEILNNMQRTHDRQVLPSMRGLQFAGAALVKNNARIFNCSYLPMDDTKAFSEIMFLLLAGCGVGFSVQKRHISKLPEIVQPMKDRKFLIGDSIEGWSDAINALIKAYTGQSKYRPRFDYSDIRRKGSQLVTAGGKAPGPEPLRICLTIIDSLLRQLPNGHQLEDTEVHDIVCRIADAVKAGGIRRAALISLFSMDSVTMIKAKAGQWWNDNPHRGRANNSANILRSRCKKKDFMKFWGMIEDAGSGDPGFYFTNDPDYGANPCNEASLREFTFCNLIECNGADVKTQEEFNDRCRAAAFIGTLQAGWTDFHYLRPIWKENTEKDALIGVGWTGIGNGNLEDIDLAQGARIVIEENARVAAIIGINEAARTTLVKPAGTTSCILGCASGIHAFYDEYYIRNIQCAIGEELYNYFMEHHPMLIEDMVYEPDTAVIGFPIKAPKNAIMRNEESALQFLERVKRWSTEWIMNGHRRGPNYNNVSATVNIKDDEWSEAGQWMWRERNNYNGLAVMPYDNGTHKNAPHETCTEYEYNKRMKYIRDNPIDLTKIVELEDTTVIAESIACGGGACEI